MRILVINAHPSSPEGQRAFNRFFDCVKEALKVYVDFLDLEDGCLVRTKDNLDDFLYGERGNYSSKTAAKRFDALDVIIVSGDVTLLPWSHGAVKLLVLLRMCVQVKKCLFACGTAMDALVYLSASDLDSAIRVINGNGRGTKLGEINNLVIPESKLGEIDCFLDATTGDLYTLKHSSKEWLPFCNVGLHNIRMAQEYNTLGKYVIQAPVYRPKKVIEDRTQNNRFYESHEILCYTKKHYSNHWLFAGCGLEFIVPHKSRWHVHSFTFTNLDKAFQVIAESKEGPLIIEYPNIIGVKFDLDKRYPQTLVLLTNFLTKYSKDIMAINRKENLSIKKELEVKYHRMEQIVFKKEKQKLSTVESTCISIGGGRARDQRTNKVVIRHMKHNSMGSPDDAEAIKHSGWAIKKSDPHEYKHNYIAPGKMPIEAYQQNLSKGGHRKSSVTAMINELFNNRSQVEKAAVTERPSYSVLNSPKDAKVIPIKNFHRKMSTGEFEAFDMIDEDQDKNKNREESIDFSAVITKSTARKILYPDLPDLRATFEKRSWIPGSLSSRKRDDTYEGSPVKVVKVDDGKYKPKSSRLFTARDGEETSPYKTIRASDPYQSAYDINKQYERKESEKIIGHRVFITSSKVTEKNNGFEENSRSPGRMASTTSGFYRH